MNYDDPIFKVPSIPSKRKAPTDPSSTLKSSKQPRVENEEPNHPDGITTNPSVSDLEQEENEPDEEGGRFYGSGVTDTQREILSYFDREDNAGEEGEVIGREAFGERDVKKLASGLDRAVSVNESRRAKFDDPAKYIDSEADLFAAVASFVVLSEHANLYPVLVETGAVERLMRLFAHENVDIAISVLEVLVELTGEDVENEKESDMASLMDALFKDDRIEVMIGNLERLNEDKDDDRQGVFHTLTILENITSFSPSYANRLPESIFHWLLSRIEKKERPVSQNKQYAAEILSIILQLSRPQLRKALALESQNLLDIVLTQLSPYRKRDPTKNVDEEEEFLENLFDSLCTCVQVPEAKSQLLTLEGVELCLLFLKGDGKVAKNRALKVLDFAVGGVGGNDVAQAIVEKGGLKVLFGIFMKKPDSETAEHLLGIFVSLFRHLAADSPERLRVLVKFVENDYEKIATLLSIREEFISRLARLDVELASEEPDPEESAEARQQRWYLRKVEGGGFAVQLCAMLMAWLAVEDTGMRKYIDEKVGLDDIVETIQDQLNNVDEVDEDDENAEIERANAKEEKEIMEVLIDILSDGKGKERGDIPANGPS